MPFVTPVRLALFLVPLLVWLLLAKYNEDTKVGTRRSRRAVPQRTVQTSEINLFGVSVETDPETSGGIEFGADGTVSLLESTKVNLVLFGTLSRSTKIRFALHDFSCDVDSDMEEPPSFEIDLDEEENSAFGPVVGRVSQVMLPKRSDYPRVYFCLSEDGKIWTPQGNSLGTHFYLVSPILPIWIRILFLIFLLSLSGLFSGLSLGLMSLDKTDLSIVSSTGSEKEKKFARKIAPVRKHGNYLLCCLLLSNVLVNVVLTLLMDSLMSGVFAVACSTLAIVIFGEIIPQSVCSRHGLAVGAHTLYITKFFMLLTAPLAYPLSLLLDKILGEEIGAVYTRERLKELLVVTEEYHGLEPEELLLIAGALGMKSKTVADVMTPLASVFMLPIESTLDYKTLVEIEAQAFTRIPIYETARDNIVAILTLKQLAPLDAGESIPFSKIIEHNPTSKALISISRDITLNHSLRQFRSGNKPHMMIVKSKAVNEGEGAETAATVGIITMEDVLAELLQNKTLEKEGRHNLRARSQKISVITPPSMPDLPKMKNSGKGKISIPPPLGLASITHLTANIAAFARTEISGVVLSRLLKTNLRRAVPSGIGDQGTFLIQAGIPAEAFIMIIEGNVEVMAGGENIPFYCGPFMCFGIEFLFAGPKPTEIAAESQKPETTKDTGGKGFQRLSTHFKRPQAIQLRRMSTVLEESKPTPPASFPKYAFTTDYSVRITGETFYLVVDFRTYRAARCASQLEKVYRTDPRGSTKRPEWRRIVEEMLTVVEKDLKYKHRGRFLVPEDEAEVDDDIGLSVDVQIATALFLGSQAEQEQSKNRVAGSLGNWQKLKMGTLSSQAGNKQSFPVLPAAVIELLRARRIRV